MPGLFREEFADPSSARSMLLEFERAFHHRAGHGREALRLLLRAKFLAMQLFQHRLVVVGVHLTDTARHEKLDHSLDLRLVMQPSIKVRVCWTNTICKHFAGQKVHQSQSAKATAHVTEKIATGFHLDIWGWRVCCAGLQF